MTQKEVEEKLNKGSKCCVDIALNGAASEMFCLEEVWVYQNILHGKRRNDHLHYHIPVDSILDLTP